MPRHGQGHGGSDCQGRTRWARWRLCWKEVVWWESEASYHEGPASNRKCGAIETSDRWYVDIMFAAAIIAEMIRNRACPWRLRACLPEAA